MIIWITGQHNAGKTTLARNLLSHFRSAAPTVDAIHLDGDVWRDMTLNKDYSSRGRHRNLELAMSAALALNEINAVVICSFISPFRETRESLKMHADVFEVYVHTSRKSMTPEKEAPAYEPPAHNYIDVDTDQDPYTCRDNVIEELANRLVGNISPAFTGEGI